MNSKAAKNAKKSSFAHRLVKRFQRHFRNGRKFTGPFDLFTAVQLLQFASEIAIIAMHTASLVMKGIPLSFAASLPQQSEPNQDTSTDTVIGMPLEAQGKRLAERIRQVGEVFPFAVGVVLGLAVKSQTRCQL